MAQAKAEGTRASDVVIVALTTRETGEERRATGQSKTAWKRPVDVLLKERTGMAGARPVLYGRPLREGAKESPGRPSVVGERLPRRCPDGKGGSSTR
jgi:hypothetical protein